MEVDDISQKELGVLTEVLKKLLNASIGLVTDPIINRCGRIVFWQLKTYNTSSNSGLLGAEISTKSLVNTSGFVCFFHKG